MRGMTGLPSLRRSCDRRVDNTAVRLKGATSPDTVWIPSAFGVEAARQAALPKSYSLSYRSTLRTNTVAPPKVTSTGYGM